MNYDIFIPVRLASSRLPNKAMKEVEGKPIISFLIDRLKKAKKIRHIVVCTTNEKSDDSLVEFLKKNNILVFRGSTEDILKRFYDAANYFEADYVIDVGADDIYTDPIFVDKIVEIFEKNDVDFVDMVDFPLGMASVGIKKNALEKICKIKKVNNTETGYRLFFTQNKIFKIFKLKPESKLNFSKDLRLTLDYNEDLELVKVILNEIGNNFDLNKILNLFEKNPKLLEITKGLDERYKQHWNKNLVDSNIRDI